MTAPTRLVACATTLDLGGREVQLLPLPPGHTDNDLVVHVPDAQTWTVGDVLEQPGPPMYGSDCFPLDWPDTLAVLLDQVGPGDVLVPGHGGPVDQQFGLAQLTQLGAVAARIRHRHAAGASVQQALSRQAGWPFPVQALELAVTRGFAQLTPNRSDPPDRLAPSG